MNDLYLENHMVIGDYYADEKLTDAERTDRMICDALNLRSWDWLDGVDVREVLTDVVHALLSAKTAEEAGIEARAELERIIEAWAEEEGES